MSDTPKNSDSQGTAAINTKKIAKMISLTNNEDFTIQQTGKRCRRKGKAYSLTTTLSARQELVERKEESGW